MEKLILPVRIYGVIASLYTPFVLFSKVPETGNHLYSLAGGIALIAGFLFLQMQYQLYKNDSYYE